MGPDWYDGRAVGSCSNCMRVFELETASHHMEEEFFSPGKFACSLKCTLLLQARTTSTRFPWTLHVFFRISKPPTYVPGICGVQVPRRHCACWFRRIFFLKPGFYIWLGWPPPFKCDKANIWAWPWSDKYSTYYTAVVVYVCDLGRNGSFACGGDCVVQSWCIRGRRISSSGVLEDRAHIR